VVDDPAILERHGTAADQRDRQFFAQEVLQAPDQHLAPGSIAFDRDIIPQPVNLRISSIPDILEPLHHSPAEAEACGSSCISRV
jgi:hypothetical protein